MYVQKCSMAAVDGPCGKIKARGYCRKHYDRWLRHGDPTVTLKRGKGVLLAELQAAAQATTSECIILTTRNGTSRPGAVLNGTFMCASRAVWILAHGDPGEDQVVVDCGRGEDGCINIKHMGLGDTRYGSDRA